ncbi:MAG: HlyD family secretion protein [Acidocella sp.]|nr:HlyD family secretion protein [Acidocella sp.]
MEPSVPQRSARPFIALGAILSTIALVFVGYWWMNRNFVTTDDAAIDGHIYTIAPRIAGQVARVAVDDNQHVAAGDVLVVLDDRDEQVGLLRAEAQQAQAQAQQAEAQAEAEASSAMLTQAQRDYDRFITINPHAITQQQVDGVTAAILSAKAKFAAAQSAIVAARAAQADAEAAVANARLQLSYTIITAPAAGHVAMKTVQTGNVVAPGSSLMALVDDHVWVTANYKETQLPGIHPGEAATIAVDGVPGVTFKARVDSIQYGTGAVFSLLPAQNATGNYVKIIQRVPVKLVFDDPRVSKYMLGQGMSVEPSIRIGK